MMELWLLKARAGVMDFMRKLVAEKEEDGYEGLVGCR